jgi:riboflavin kinase / FMN adenylyltransferase
VLVIENTEYFRIEKPTIVTIGTFDGVHLGHQKILQRLSEIKAETGFQTLVLTFEPHPRKVLFPDQRDLRLLTLVDEKLDLLRSFGVDVAVVYPFSRQFSELASDVYIREILCSQLKTRKLVIGYDHRFGKGRTGDIRVLRQAAKENGFEVEEISARDIDSIAISSTKIRKALEEGKLDLAAEFLGHPYFLNAQVIQGKQLGRSIGYPTANLKTAEEKLIPRNGVYFVKLEVEGQWHFGMLNIGTNPTTDRDDSVKIEVHLFDFDRTIYFRSVRLQFIRRLRDEKNFKGLEELTAALDEDKKNCLLLMNVR